MFLILSQTLSVWAFDYEPQNDCKQILDYTHYSLCYSPEHQQAAWTIHLLNKESIRGKQNRTNDFRADHNATPAVSHRAYKGSGYDRGHLVPAADMKLDKTAMSETFFMTNMSPQSPSFNRGIWRSLEYGFRKAVLEFGSAYVVTAPLLEDDLRTIKSGVPIPNFYYKIAYFPEAGFMMAFILPNRSMKGENYRDHSVSVDELEERTGIDFFSELPDELERRLEEKVY